MQAMSSLSYRPSASIRGIQAADAVTRNGRSSTTVRVRTKTKNLHKLRSNGVPLEHCSSSGLEAYPILLAGVKYPPRSLLDKCCRLGNSQSTATCRMTPPSQPELAGCG